MAGYKIHTFGCQMNVHESEKMAGVLSDLGYEAVENDEDADIILYNTCCVRENAENHVIGNIGAIKPLKKKNKNLIIIVGGCVTQQKGFAEKLQSMFPFIDIIFGTFNSSNLRDFLLKRINEKKKVFEIWDDDGLVNENYKALRTSYPNAWVNIMYGCNNFCTYCIVPYVRGRERSREPQNILNEVKGLLKEGYKEITLLGQNVNSYGKDLKDGITFTELLKMVDDLEGDFRIRFMSNHPKDITPELIDLIKSSDKICKCIHLPVQSGSTAVLKRMNRKYTREGYLSIVEMMREKIPDIAITTDIMVGFPGETDEDFLDSMSLLDLVKYDGAFTFVYSKRKGTVAAAMEDQVPEDIKRERIIKMVDLQNSINRERSSKLLGSKVVVLCEDYDGKKEMYMGRDDKNRMIYFKSDKDLIGQFVNCIIKETGGISLFGEII